MTDDRIGAWLRETRLRQVMPGTRKPWSQEYLLDQMRESGWAPHRPNYSKYETGKSHPEPETLDKFIAFWAERGEQGPDLSPEPTTATETPDPLTAALMAQTAALTALVDELRQWRTEDHAKLGDLELAVRALAGPALDGPATPAGATPPVPGGTTG